MAQKFLSPVDMTKLEIQNLRLQNLASDPSSPVVGQAYFNTSTNRVRTWNGSTWTEYGTGGGSVTSVGLSLPAELTVASSPVTSSGTISATWANQTTNKVFAAPNGSTGTPSFRVLVAADIPTLTAAKISDFDTQVRTSRLDQMTAPTGAVSLNGQKITSLGTPTASTDAATKGYVDTAVQGLDQKPTAFLATAAALPACTYANGSSGVGATLTADANGQLTVDGVALTTAENGLRVLVKNQVTGAQNGLYVITQPGDGSTPFILTRDTQMDTTGEFTGAFIPVEDAGTANGNSLWLCTNSADPTVGTTSITFIQLNKGTDLQAGTGITISGNTVSINTSWVGQAAITTLGTITTGVWNGTDIAVADGGTGSSTAAGARTNLGATGKYSALIGDTSTTAFTVTQGTHGLASNAQMHVAVYDASTGAQVFPDVSINNSNGTVTITFAAAPDTNAYRYVIIG